MKMQKLRIRNKTTQFLTGSLIFISLLCILVFGSMLFFMNQRSAETIGQVGRLYMSGINERIANHFDTLISTRFSYVEAVIEYTPPGTEEDFETTHRRLEYSAQIRGFEYLAFFTEDGSVENLYGDSMEILEKESFVETLKNGERKVTVGIGSGDERILLLGIPAAYTMENGKKSIALVAGMSIDNVKKILALDEGGLPGVFPCTSERRHVCDPKRGCIPGQLL